MHPEKVYCLFFHELYLKPNSYLCLPQYFPKLHNAAWPGVVGKGTADSEPAISLETMLEMTAKAEVDGVKFDGVDLFLYDSSCEYRSLRMTYRLEVW